MTQHKTKHAFLRQTGNAVVIILVIVAGISAGIFLFSRYDAQQAADSGDSAFPEISEEADVESMRERLDEIRDDREARETEEEAAANDTQEEGAGAADREDAANETSEVESHADERGEVLEGEGDPEGSQTTYAGTRLAGNAALPMLEFSQADYDMAVAANETIVLMFHANWCPLCQAEEPDSRAAFDQLAEQGVDGAVGFRVHFQDNETTQAEKDLAAQYNVGFQNSKIIINNGEVVSQASYETWSTARYKSEIQAAL